jgi:hypothetical protein
MNWPVRAANGEKLEVILLPKFWNLLISMAAIFLVVIVGMRGEEGGDGGWTCAGGACVERVSGGFPPDVSKSWPVISVKQLHLHPRLDPLIQRDVWNRVSA